MISPADLDFAAALEKVKMRVHQTLHANETSVRCHWLIPATHFLESWSDVARIRWDATIVQPLIEPALCRNFRARIDRRVYSAAGPQRI